jgi:hypothetical protein
MESASAMVFFIVVNSFSFLCLSDIDHHKRFPCIAQQRRRRISGRPSPERKLRSKTGFAD